MASSGRVVTVTTTAAVGCINITPCTDAEGTLYFTRFTRDGIFDPCVWKAHRQWGRYAPPLVLAGVTQQTTAGAAAAAERAHVDGDAAAARFSEPRGLCINPLDRTSLLIMDRSRVRAVDTVSGHVTTLAITGYRPAELRSCASGGGDQPHVWMVDSLEGSHRYTLLLLDMRSLHVAEVTIKEPALRLDSDGLMCTDGCGNAVCTHWQMPRLWRVRPDGTTTLLAGTDEAGYRDGPAAQAQIGTRLWAAAAGDGSIVVADQASRRLRLVSPDGMVSTLAGSGGEGSQDGPAAGASFGCMSAVTLSPGGDVLVVDRTVVSGRVQCILRTVSARLPPPAHLAPPAPARLPSDGPAALCSGLLRSGRLADATLRVVHPGGRRPLQQPQEAAAGATVGAAAVAAAGAGPGPQLPASGEEGEAEADIPCHRAILAEASPYFRALFAGPLARRPHAEGGDPATTAGGGGGVAGRKRKAADDPAGSSGSDGGAGDAPTANAEGGVVVTVDDASADAVRTVLRHVYTGDLGGLCATTAQDVLHLAQQWGLDVLLAECQAHVVQELLGAGNAAEWLVCAHLRQYGAIRAAALRTVVDSFAAVQGDEAQVALLKAHPDLMFEAMALGMGAAAAAGLGPVTS